MKIKTIETEILDVIEELNEIEKNIKHVEAKMSTLRLLIESMINVKQEVLNDDRRSDDDTS